MQFPAMDFAARGGSRSLFRTQRRAADAQIRVNQVGFLANDSKRALLMATDSERTAIFQVIGADGAVALASPVGNNRGSWNPAYANVYELDFSAVKAPGTYSIKVDGAVFGHFAIHFKSARAEKFSRRCCAMRCFSFKRSATGRMF